MDNENDGRDKKHVMGYHLICSLSCDEEDGCGNRFGSMSEKEPERGSEEDLCTWRRGDFCGWPSLPRTTQVLIDFRSGRAIPRLREGRPLYGSSAHMSHSLSRWPRECQVIPEEIHHIEWVPPVPELFCGQMNPDERVQVPEEQDGIVVYDAGGVKERFFSGSCLGGRRAPLEDVAVSLAGPDDTTLLFEARGEYDYDLTLRTDLYTNRHTQWFYFRVKNTRAHVPYRFTISNLLKESNLFKQGQRPLLYSEEKARTQRVGWHRAGQDVTYHRNGCQHAGRPCHSLSWTLSFPYNRDTCYLALCYPYTYSNLRAHLSEIEGDPERSRFCKVRTLCRSLAGNLVPVLTITNPSQWEEEGGVARKPAVVLTARVHPGETNSSWVMKGVVDFLLGTSSKAALLRDSFLFKLVPMLNPDGVIVGNCRCSLAGHDLNRSYNSVFRDCFPSVVSVRAMTQRLCEERMVLMYCDFHGHSRRQNAFAYGCESPRLGQKHSRARVFPLMLSKNCPDMSCKFKVQRSKEGTGRVALWRLGVLNSFTLETSLCGSDMVPVDPAPQSLRGLQPHSRP
ncbi:hypothetical protein JZ751_022288 [Albula glossodonta]|uniref:Peptidase M14 domain-containing protein n=1 Tax=Albula glossodonta TaxID=121402 RepID=A0A8T2NH86_9TELE|nr:hypothetical protein JZ751_022288 [Albula glossodonta]